MHNIKIWIMTFDYFLDLIQSNSDLIILTITTILVITIRIVMLLCKLALTSRRWVLIWRVLIEEFWFEEFWLKKNIERSSWFYLLFWSQQVLESDVCNNVGKNEASLWNNIWIVFRVYLCTRWNSLSKHSWNNSYFTGCRYLSTLQR